MSKLSIWILPFLSVSYHRGHILFKFAFVTKKLVPWIHSYLNCALGWWRFIWYKIIVVVPSWIIQGIKFESLAFFWKKYFNKYITYVTKSYGSQLLIWQVIIYCANLLIYLVHANFFAYIFIASVFWNAK